MENMNDIYLIYSCDEWKSYSLIRLISATCHKEKILTIIADEI